MNWFLGNGKSINNLQSVDQACLYSKFIDRKGSSGYGAVVWFLEYFDLPVEKASVHGKIEMELLIHTGVAQEMLQILVVSVRLMEHV